MPLATLGMFILWFGWFGFNGGSELVVSNIEEANAVALIFVNTNTAAAAGLIGALLSRQRWYLAKPTSPWLLNGALAGSGFDYSRTPDADAWRGGTHRVGGRES